MITQIRRVPATILLALAVLLALPVTHSAWRTNARSLQFGRIDAFLDESPYLCRAAPERCVPGNSTWQVAVRGDAIVLSQDGISRLVASDRVMAELVTAIDLLEAGNRSSAVDLLRDVPYSASYFRTLGDEAPVPTAAIKHYQLSIDIEPSPSAYFGLGNAYVDSGQPEAAIDMLERAIADDSPQATGLRFQAYSELARAYDMVGDSERARLNFEHSLAVRPGWPPSIIGLARIDIAEGATARAIDRLENGIVINPDNVRLRAELARVYVDQNRHADTFRVLNVDDVIEGDNLSALKLLGDSALLLDRRSVAIQAYTRYLQLQPEDSVIREALRELEQ